MKFSFLFFKKPKLEGNFANFVLVSSERSGSGYLNSLLASHREITMAGEHFHGKRMRDSSFKRLDMVDELERSLKRRKAERVRGIKFLHHQLHPEYADHLDIASYKRLQEFLLVRDDLKIVHLTRKNKLRLVLSRHVVRKTGVCHVKKNKNSAKSIRDLSIYLDPRIVIEDIEKTQWYEDSFRKQYQGREMHEVIYEDLLTQTHQVLSGVQKYLDVCPSELVSDQMRLSSRDLREVIENYDELRREMRSCGMEDYFD